MVSLRTVTALTLVVLGLARPASAGFDPTEETPGLGNQLSVLSLEVREANAGAAGRLNGLWAGSGRGLVRMEDGSILSLAGWLEGSADRAGLAKVVEAAGGGRVLPVVRAAAGDPAATPLELYAKARSIAIGSDLGEALALVGDRALAWGDVTTAADLYDAAKAFAWSPDATREAVIKQQASAVPVKAVPTPAGWFNDPKSLMVPRVFPVTVADRTFVAGVAGLVALKGDAVLWTNVWGDAEDFAASVPVAGAAGRGPSCVPAVLPGVGAAQVLVVSTPPTVDLPGSLRGVRASDGRTLWDSADDDANREVRFVGPVTIAGRYVYAPAVQATGTSATLLLVCLDVTSGRQLWQCVLGTVVDTARDRNRRPLEHHWHQSAPLVAGDRVYVAPGVGYVFAIGRFDGGIRWGRPYTVTEADENEVRQFRDRLRNRQPVAPPVHPLQAMKYMAGVERVGDVLVCAPLDTPSTLGLDVRTGAMLWERKEQDPPTLVGAAGGSAIFAGTKVTGIDPKTGQDKWTAVLDAADAVQGPVSLVDGKVVIPTADATIVVDPAGGAVVSKGPRNLQAALKADAVRSALSQIGAIRTLEVEPAKK